MKFAVIIILTLLNIFKSVYLSNPIQKVSEYNTISSNPTCNLSGVHQHPNWQFLPKKCGITKMKHRIIGGNIAYPGEFPWVVKLTYAAKTAKPSVFVKVGILCSAGLISQYYAITAYHCTQLEKGAFVNTIVVGKNMLKLFRCPETQCDDFTQIHKVEKVIQYSFENADATIEHDIALVKTKTPVKFNEYIQPLCLPKGDIIDNLGLYIKSGEYLTVTGFGAIDKVKHQFTSRTKLLYAHLSIQPIKACKRRPFIDFKKIDTSLICAGDPPNKDTCAGDSGSPAIMPISVKGPPRNYLIGIVSFGLTKCALDYAAYVNVACYIRWILDNIQM